jgi:hypothetical protein
MLPQRLAVVGHRPGLVDLPLDARLAVDDAGRGGQAPGRRADVDVVLDLRYDDLRIRGNCTLFE